MTMPNVPADEELARKIKKFEENGGSLANTCPKCLAGGKITLLSNPSQDESSGELIRKCSVHGVFYMMAHYKT